MLHHHYLLIGQRAAQLSHGTLIRVASTGATTTSTATEWWSSLSSRRCSTTSSRYYATSSPAASSTSNSSSSSPPPKLNEEMILGVQNATLLLIRYGLGKKHLLEVAKGARGPLSTLVPRWQKMMQGYLGSQVHILAGLGYPPDEHGVSLYQYQFNEYVSTAAPETQERLRKLGRDVWRQVLSIAFDIPQEQMMRKGAATDAQEELSIVDARNIMFKISQKMMEPSLLESISRQVANATAAATTTASNKDSSDSNNALLTMKHTLVQQVLVNEVYFGDNGILLTECGFPPGEEGYVALQCAIAEHQTDPLVAQYMGGAMMRVLQAAGLDGATREMAETINKHAAASSAASSTPNIKK